jgi:hypothetical protein
MLLLKTDPEVMVSDSPLCPLDITQLDTIDKLCDETLGIIMLPLKVVNANSQIQLACDTSVAV